MLTAADVMTADVVSVGPHSTIREIVELLLARRISGVPVVEDSRVIGIVSEGDLIGHAAIIGERHQSWWQGLFADEALSARDYVKRHGRSARDVMTAQVISIAENTTVGEVVQTMQEHRIKRVPVLRDGRLVGIVTRGDLLRGAATLIQQAAPTVGDEAIQDQLVTELREQPWAHLIDVRVENGIVHLYGTFQSEDERHALRVAAENVPGVRSVEDHLTPWNSTPIGLSGQG
jgi:CBS domain-containing protein